MKIEDSVHELVNFNNKTVELSFEKTVTVFLGLYIETLDKFRKEQILTLYLSRTTKAQKQLIEILGGQIEELGKNTRGFGEKA